MSESQEKMLCELIGKKFDVLDHGFIRVVDIMGNDSAVVQAARVSYGDGTKTKREDGGLINYLMKHRHTSPFEMCEIKLHIKLPIFIARQWIRHRTANVNECSARYSIVPEDFYVPSLENILPQSEMNKQCRGGEISELDAQAAQDLIVKSSKESYKNYIKLLDDESRGEETDGVGIAREIARGVLPVNMYTEWYWKIDLHNLLHFIKLRIHQHAQYEIRVYAEILAKIVKEWCPLTFSAFEEHVLYAQTFSKSQIDALKNLLSGVEISDENLFNQLARRELEELKDVFSWK